jgi:hypothetical protein
MCGVCKAVGLVLGLVVALAMVAALLGVYMAHTAGGTWTFGTAEGSLSLLTLGLLVLVLKKCMKMCPCRSKGCGSGCGGGAGMCPGCGKEPCACK